MSFFKTTIAKYAKRTDWLLLFFGCIATFIGLILIYSATRSYGTEKHMIVQGGAAALGVFAFLAITTFDFERISDFWIPLLVLNLLFIGSLYFLGTGGDTTGNNSWIRFGPIGIQPAELGKLVFIVTFAKHMSVCRERLNSPFVILQLLLHGGANILFVYVFSEDLGMAAAYIFIFVIMFFLGGVSVKWLVPMAAVGGLSLPLIWKYVLGKYQKDRVLVLFDPSINPTIAYHAQQSKIALGSGKIFGRGYLQGRQTQYALLPAKHTDFIFSVAGEEFGLVGCSIILLLLSSVVLRIFYNASRMSSSFSFLVCSGIGAMFMIQTIINVGMCVGIMPVIGLTLPFMSYGGTSLVTMFCALGIVSSLVVRNKPNRVR